MLHRLQLSRSDPLHADAYPNAEGFRADLELLNESLSVNRGERLGQQLLDPLIRQVRTFGFHLHTLDIRQDAHVHANAVRELAAGVSQEGDPRRTIPPEPSQATAAMLDSFPFFSDLIRNVELGMAKAEFAKGSPLLLLVPP